MEKVYFGLFVYYWSNFIALNNAKLYSNTWDLLVVLYCTVFHLIQNKLLKKDIEPCFI